MAASLSALVVFAAILCLFAAGSTSGATTYLVGVFNNTKCFEFLAQTPIATTSGTCISAGGVAAHMQVDVAGSNAAYRLGCSNSSCNLCQESGSVAVNACANLTVAGATVWAVQNATLTGGFYTSSSCNVALPTVPPMTVQSGVCTIAVTLGGGIVLYYVGNNVVAAGLMCGTSGTCGNCTVNAVIPLNTCVYFPQQAVWGKITMQGTTTSATTSTQSSTTATTSSSDASSLRPFWLFPVFYPPQRLFFFS